MFLIKYYRDAAKRFCYIPNGGVAKYFATPPNHFATGKMVACGRVLSLAIARSTQKGPLSGPFTLFW
jgi:hypothetical protein